MKQAIKYNKNVNPDKRNPRTYKVKDEPYYKAVRRSWKRNTDLVKILEKVVVSYSKCHTIIEKDKNGNVIVIAA